MTDQLTSRLPLQLQVGPLSVGPPHPIDPEWRNPLADCTQSPESNRQSPKGDVRQSSI